MRIAFPGSSKDRCVLGIIERQGTCNSDNSAIFRPTVVLRGYLTNCDKKYFAIYSRSVHLWARVSCTIFPKVGPFRMQKQIAKMQVKRVGLRLLDADLIQQQAVSVRFFCHKAQKSSTKEISFHVISSEGQSEDATERR